MSVLALLGALLWMGWVAIPASRAPLSIEEQMALDRYRRILATLHAERAARLDAETLRQLDAFDPARTGLVGLDWSYLVTTQGDLDAKRVSAHPVWVLQFLEWFREAGLQPGDTVAVGASASFPALLYSLRAAAEAHGLRVRAVVSLTASNHGATIPDFDIWHIEETVLRQRLLAPAIAALTPGGMHDAALYLGEEETRRLRARLDTIARVVASASPPPDRRRSSFPFGDVGSPSDTARVPAVHWPASLEDARAFRERILFASSDTQPPPALFVNIGGNSANTGTGTAALLLPRGFIPAGSHPLSLATSRSSRGAASLPPGHGAIHLALARGLPVVHLLDVRSVLAARGLAPSGLATDDEALLRVAGRARPTTRILAALAAASLVGLLFFISRETLAPHFSPPFKEL